MTKKFMLFLFIILLPAASYAESIYFAGDSILTYAKDGYASCPSGSSVFAKLTAGMPGYTWYPTALSIENNANCAGGVGGATSLNYFGDQNTCDYNSTYECKKYTCFNTYSPDIILFAISYFNDVVNLLISTSYYANITALIFEQQKELSLLQQRGYRVIVVSSYRFYEDPADSTHLAAQVNAYTDTIWASLRPWCTSRNIPLIDFRAYIDTLYPAGDFVKNTADGLHMSCELTPIMYNYIMANWPSLFSSVSSRYQNLMLQNMKGQ